MIDTNSHICLWHKNVYNKQAKRQKGDKIWALQLLIKLKDLQKKNFKNEIIGDHLKKFMDILPR